MQVKDSCFLHFKLLTGLILNPVITTAVCHISSRGWSCAKCLFTCTFCVNAMVHPRSRGLLLPGGKATWRLHNASERGVLSGWKWAKWPEELCVCVCPGLGSAHPAPSKVCWYRLEFAGIGPASASGRAVSKRTVHWKIDRFPGTAENCCILEINTAPEPFLVIYYRVGFVYHEQELRKNYL